jgi:hypothetical protein
MTLRIETLEEEVLNSKQEIDPANKTQRAATGNTNQKLMAIRQESESLQSV